MKNLLKLTIASAALIISMNVANAQPAGGGPGGPPAGGPPPCWPPPCIPIDGGVGFLIAAGVALGGKKLYDHNKNQNNEKLS